MKNSFLFILVSLALFLSSCGKKPEACINASVLTAKLGQDITFTDCSKNAYEWSWNMGDGKTFTDETLVIHAYETPGTFRVKLEIENKKGSKSDETTTDISVAAPVINDILGKWTLFKITEPSYYGGGGETVVSTPMDTYIFNSNDTIQLIYYNYPSDTGLISYIFLSSEATLSYSGTTYTITKLYNNEMVLNTGSFGFYDKYYFRK